MLVGISFENNDYEMDRVSDFYSKPSHLSPYPIYQKGGSYYPFGTESERNKSYKGWARALLVPAAAYLGLVSLYGKKKKAQNKK